MSLGRRRKKILDGESIFKYYYIEMGDARSYNKLARWASAKWGRNPETRKDWTTGAVWQAAWRWAFENLDYAKRVYSDTLLQHGETLTDEEWYGVLSQHAKTCMTPTQYRRFLVKHPELKPYEIL